ncbi:MAG: serine/threonine protein kinase [Myxococcales bacterium]|nr:serine/threonine protein kinase [Myxococcales bacterium]MBL0194716.1 serine/threonine protein kinase [Myxococcales bacterium]
MRQAPTQMADPTSESKLESWAPRPGEVVGGRFRVLHTLGQGGMGAVVAAAHLQLGQSVAIKFLHPKLARDAGSVERFHREARATMRIKSEHVVRVSDVGTSDAGLPFIVMELLEGADLGHVVAAGPLAISDAVDYVLQASEALAEAHAVGIVHRDLKPTNLWLAKRPDGTPLVKVLDFGISKLSTHAPGDVKLTETQSVFGSPTYMSPEQIRSAKRVDHRTDVWALGIVLHELLTGQLPFDGDTVSGVLASIAADPPLPLRHSRPDAPPGLEQAILRCLEKDVTRRCQSLAELAALLAPFASPVGTLSAGRIGRLGAPQGGSFAPSPASSAGDVGAFGITERSIVTPGRARSPVFGVALGMGLALLIIGGVAGIARLGAARGGTAAAAPTASAGVAAAPPSARILAAATPPASAAWPGSSVAPAASAAPAASTVPAAKPAHPNPRPGRPSVPAKPGATAGPAGAPTVAPTVAEGRD